MNYAQKRKNYMYLTPSSSWLWVWPDSGRENMNHGWRLQQPDSVPRTINLQLTCMFMPSSNCPTSDNKYVNYLCTMIRMIQNARIQNHEKNILTKFPTLPVTLSGMSKPTECRLIPFKQWLVKRVIQCSKPWCQKQPIRTFCFSMNGYHSIYTVDLTSVVSNYKSLLITTSE